MSDQQQREARLAADEAIRVSVLGGSSPFISQSEAVEYALEVLRWAALRPDEVKVS